MLQPGLQGPQDGQPWVASIAWPHDPRRHQGRQQGGIALAAQRRSPGRGLVQLGHEGGRGLARLAAPEARGAGLLPAGRQGFREGRVGGDHVGQVRIRRSQGRGEGRRQVRQALDPAARSSALRGLPQRRQQAGESRRRPGAAQHLQLQLAHPAAKGPGGEPAGRQRVLERRQQLDGRQLAGRQLRRQPEEPARRRVAQRDAGRIVYLDVPAAQFRRHPARERPVRRDQACGPARMLQGLAQMERDDQGLLARGRAVDPAEPGERRVQPRPVQRRPVRRQATRRRRAQGQVEDLGPGGGGRRRVGPGPCTHRLAGHAEALQQDRQAVLRMGRFGANRFPDRRVGREIEAGQHDLPPRQAGHGFDQGGAGGDASGGAGGDHRICRGRRPPGLGLAFEKPPPAFGGTDGPLGGLDLGPVVGQDSQEIQRLLPVLGIALGRQVGQGIEIQALGLDLVQEPGQLGGQAGGLVLAGGVVGTLLRAGPGQDEPRQQKLPAQRRDRRRQVVFAPGARQALLGAQQQLVLVQVAQWPHPRQHERPAARGAQEGLAQSAAGAPGRQQDQGVGQGQGFAAPAVQDAAGQGIDEGGSGGDRIDGRPRAAHRWTAPSLR